MSKRKLHSSADQRFELSEDSFHQVIHGKYRLRILWNLKDGPRRFGEIKKRLNHGAAGTKGVAPRVLSRVLKALTEVGLVRRRAYDTVPPRVEYSLTPLGRTLLPIISRLHDWGIRHVLPQSALGIDPFASLTTESHSDFTRSRISPGEQVPAGK